MWLALVAPNGCFIVFAAAILMSHPYTICEIGLQDYKHKYKHSKSTIHHLRDRLTKLCTKTSTYKWHKPTIEGTKQVSEVLF